MPVVVQALTAAGIKPRSIQLLGTGLWDDPRIFSDANAARRRGTPRPTPTASAISRRAIARRFGQDPVRTATLSYDAVALVAALVKTQGEQRFSEQVLTNPSGFAGIDGLFRFRTDGTNERGLAVLRVGPTGGQVDQPAAARVRRLGDLAAIAALRLAQIAVVDDLAHVELLVRRHRRRRPACSRTFSQGRARTS